MTTNQDPVSANRASGAALGFVLAVVLFAALAVIAKLSIAVPAVDADRGAVRSKDLAEIRATEETSLSTAGWIDKSRGTVRLPIEDAMKLAAQKWQDPAQAMADLKAREDKATAPAPVAPVKPNPFE